MKIATIIFSLIFALLGVAAHGQSSDQFSEKFQNQELRYSELSASTGFSPNSGSFIDVRASAFRINPYSWYTPGIVLQTDRYADNISGMIHTRVSPFGITVNHNRGPGIWSATVTAGFMQSGIREVSPSLGSSCMFMAPRIIAFAEVGAMTANRSIYFDGWAKYKLIRTTKDFFWDVGLSLSHNQYIGGRVSADVVWGFHTFGIRVSAGSAFGTPIPSGDGPLTHSGHKLVASIGLMIASF